MLGAKHRAEYEGLNEEWLKQRAEKEQLEREVAERQARVRQLEASILSTKADLAMLAPINTLPDDVMIGIVRTGYLHRFPHCRADDGLYNTHSPVAFSQVCRRWRSLAIGMPALWTCVHVTPQQSNRYAEMVKLYIERSRNRALSVSFVCNVEPVENFRDFNVTWSTFYVTVWPRFMSCWEVLLAHSHRWKHCAIYSSRAKIAAYVTRSLRGCIFPRLEYFAHRLFHEDYMRGPGIRFFAPNLKRIDLINISTFIPETDAFRRLTELKLVICVDIPELLGVLQQTSSLTRLTLKTTDLYHSAGATGGTSSYPICLPHLRFLALVDYHGYHPSVTIISRIFRGAPSLDTLVIWNADVVFHELRDSRISLLPSVHTLHYGPFSQEARIIQQGKSVLCPDLEELELVCSGAPGILHAVFDLYQSSKIVAWPKLRSLTLPARLHMHESTLLLFIEHRTQIGHPLRTVKLSAKSVQRLSPQAKTILATHPVELIAHTDDLVDDWLGDDWNYERNAPIYLPWDGSLEFWDQF